MTYKNKPEMPRVGLEGKACSMRNVSKRNFPAMLEVIEEIIIEVDGDEVPPREAVAYIQTSVRRLEQIVLSWLVSIEALSTLKNVVGVDNSDQRGF